MTSYNNLTDIELTALLNDGDELAFTEIFNRFQPLLFLHTLKKVPDEDEAKDILQEIFTDLWVRHKDISAEKNLTAYLYTCVRNKFVNRLQHQQVRASYAASFTNFVTQNPETADAVIREKQLSAIIEQEINALPPKMKAVFVLSRHAHKSYKEIAEELNISEETVRKQVKNSLKILRTKLGLVLYLLMLLWY